MQQQALHDSGYASLLKPRWLHEQPAGAGLHNLGNTCFCASVLQCLAYVPPVGHLVLHDRRALHGFECPWAGQSTCTACLLSSQLREQLRRTEPFRPLQIVGNFRLVSKSLVRGRQEDCHEFLHWLLDAVERDSHKGLVSLGAKKGAWTLVQELFQGCTVSQVCCLSCGHQSNTFEAFTTLSLDVSGAVSSLQQSLGVFTAAEILDGANKYKCDRCKCLVRARKQVAMYDEPNLLAVHLKRFCAFTSNKVGRHVAFAPQLDLQPFSAHTLLGLQHPAPGQTAEKAAGRGLYHLTGVLVHQGSSASSGHYYCYVKDSLERWHCMNDEAVGRVSLQHVLEQQAYMLFYSRTVIKAARRPPTQQQHHQHHQHHQQRPSPVSRMKLDACLAPAGPPLASPAAGITGTGPLGPNQAPSGKRPWQDVSPSSQQLAAAAPGRPASSSTLLVAAPHVKASSLPAKVGASTRGAPPPRAASIPEPLPKPSRGDASGDSAWPLEKRSRTAAPEAELIPERSAASSRPAAMQAIKAQIMDKLKGSAYEAELHRRLTAFCAEALSASSATSHLELLQELREGKSTRVQELKGPMQALLSKLEPGVLSWALAAVKKAAVLPGPD